MGDYKKLANIIMNIFIPTDICEYEYEYKFFPHKKGEKKDMFMD